MHVLLQVAVTTYFAIGFVRQAWIGEPAPWSLLAVLPVQVLVALAYAARVRRVVVHCDGRVSFGRAFGSRTVPVHHVLCVRPWFGISRSDFVVELTEGFELLFGDPTAVSVLARDLAALQPKLRTTGVPVPRF